MSLISEEILSAEILEARAEIDRQLDRHSSFDSNCPERLREAIRYSLLAPGKRIRPLLVLMAAKACGGRLDEAMPAACAVEMIHTYSLIHDDLPAMDDDDIRRGRPSCHVAFGEDIAILAGDALIPLAFEVMSKNIFPADRAVECCTALASAAGASRLVGGQADDLSGPPEIENFDSMGQSESQELLKWLEKVHHRKTGALLATSLELGAITAGASAEKRQALSQYGRNLGLGFQIVDDLLDLFGNQAKIGKPVGSDQSCDKLTYPRLLGEIESRRLAEEQIDQAIVSLSCFGSDADELIRLARFVVQRNF